MIQSIRERLRFSPAVVIAFVALVFAMTGGAWAVTQHSNRPHKAKKGPRGAKGATGSEGPAGQQGGKGDPGAPGKGGENGEKGTQGIQGTQGDPGLQGEKGDTGEKGDKGDTGERGEKGETGERGERGEAGSPWTAGGTLPNNKSETGTWSAGEYGATAGPQAVSISFSLPLPMPLGEGDIHFLEVGEEHTTECPGSVEEPAAAPGNLCIYSAEFENLTFMESAGFPDSFTTGVVIGFLAEPGEPAWGPGRSGRKKPRRTEPAIRRRPACARRAGSAGRAGR